MTTLDWTIVAALMGLLVLAALATRRHTTTVGAFLVANRCGGRYLIAMAKGMAGLGVITFMWFCEQNYKVGFTAQWWSALQEPALIVVALSGWVVYRFRQTRAMTLAQFFELRYSRRFRIFAGLVAFGAGLVNFGIFPAVGARFFIHLCGLSEELYPWIMAGLLALSLAFTFIGGHIAVMVTDFFQGAFANVVFAVVCVFILVTIGWDRIGVTMTDTPSGHSLLNPFDIAGEDEFNVVYFMIQTLVVFYSVLAWQGTQAYESCAKSPHEAKMAGILNGWRFRVLLVIAVIVPVGVRTLLHHPDFAATAGPINDALSNIDSRTLRDQARIPMALAAMLPAGLLGLFCASMLAALISTHDTYMHSWGSIFVQDVIMPFRKKPLTPRQHLWVLRGAIGFVAVFIFCFGMVFRQQEKIAMYLTITGAIFFVGGGAALIGGLYWRHGSTRGAWAAMITGMAVAVTGIVGKQIAPEVWYTGQHTTFLAMVSSVLAYVVFSLTRPDPCDIDALLHRTPRQQRRRPPRRGLRVRLGIDAAFDRRDRVVTYISVGWPVAWTLIVAVGSVYALVVSPSTAFWLVFWRWWTYIVVGGSIVVTVWFTIGGARDVMYLFRHLSGRANPAEDGRVEGHRNIGEPHEQDEVDGLL